MIDAIHFDRMGAIDDKYAEMSIEKLSEIIQSGKALVEQHGEENLNNILENEEQFLAVGALFDYRIAADESLYEAK